MWITQLPKIVVSLLETPRIFYTNGTIFQTFLAVALLSSYSTEKSRWVPLISQQTDGE